MLSGGYEASMPPQPDDVLPDSDALFNFDPQDVFGPNLGQTWQTPHAIMQFSNNNLFERQNNMFYQGSIQNINAFSFDQTWTCDPAFLTASPKICGSVDLGRGNQAQELERRGRTTLAPPYEVEPEALDSMFNNAYKSRTKMAMQAYYLDAKSNR